MLNYKYNYIEFKLSSSLDNSEIQYNYICNSASDIGSSIAMNTIAATHGNFSVNYLDQFNIKCNPGYAIGNIQLARTGGSDLPDNQYNYTCLPVPNLDVCVNKSTPVTNNQEGSIISLTNLDVRCDPSQVLNEVQLKTSTSGTDIYYDYVCCSR